MDNDNVKVEKRDAVDVACRYIVALDTSIENDERLPQPEYCVSKKEPCRMGEKSRKNCFKCAKQFFESCATKPDGWKVVEEFYKELEDLKDIRTDLLNKEDSVEKRSMLFAERQLLDILLFKLDKKLQEVEKESE